MRYGQEACSMLIGILNLSVRSFIPFTDLSNRISPRSITSAARGSLVTGLLNCYLQSAESF
jgi:hypothetical protein